METEGVDTLGIMTPVRVLIVDDDALVRTGLVMMLREAPDIEVVAEAADGQEALSALAHTDVDLVLMDIRMPHFDGLSATEMIRAAPRPPEVVVLTTFDADAHVHRALRAGAAGFLLKDTPPEQIVDSIRRIADGEPVLSSSVLKALIERTFTGETAARAAEARDWLAVLNERERDVADDVGSGMTNAEIADHLYIAVPTVKTHVSAALTKLGLSNRVQLALFVHEAKSTGAGVAAPRRGPGNS